MADKPLSLDELLERDNIDYSAKAETEQPKKQPKQSSDYVKALKAGVYDLPSQAAGLADVVPGLLGADAPVSRFTDLVGEKSGWQPSKTAEEIRASYSPEVQAEIAKKQAVWNDPNADWKDIAAEYIANPKSSAVQALESVPGMVAGGAIGKGVQAAAANEYQSHAINLKNQLKTQLGSLPLYARQAANLAAYSETSSNEEVSRYLNMLGIVPSDDLAANKAALINQLSVIDDITSQVERANESVRVLPETYSSHSAAIDKAAKTSKSTTHKYKAVSFIDADGNRMYHVVGEA